MHDRCPLPIPRAFWKEHLLVLQVMRCMYTLEAAGTRSKNFPEGAFGNSPAGDEMHVNFESSVAWCDSDKKQLQSCNKTRHQQGWPNISINIPACILRKHKLLLSHRLLKHICFVSGPGPLQLASSEGNSPENRLR